MRKFKRKVLEALRACTPPNGARDPVSKIIWVPTGDLYANGYNPNHVAPPEMALLKISIMEDGFTQPVVVKPDGEIVDGFHRWTLASTDADMIERYDGLCPVAVLAPTDKAHQMMSTIRHNRARGTHKVAPMGSIVRELAGQCKVSEAEIMRRLGMEPEEVERLSDTGGMVSRGAGEAFNAGWVPASPAETK